MRLYGEDSWWWHSGVDDAERWFIIERRARIQGSVGVGQCWRCWYCSVVNGDLTRTIPAPECGPYRFHNGYQIIGKIQFMMQRCKHSLCSVVRASKMRKSMEIGSMCRRSTSAGLIYFNIEGSWSSNMMPLSWRTFCGWCETHQKDIWVEWIGSTEGENVPLVTTKMMMSNTVWSTSRLYMKIPYQIAPGLGIR